MSKNVSDAGRVGEDRHVISLPELLQEDDLRGALGMLLKEGTKEVLRIQFPAKLRQVSDMVAGVVGEECPVGRCLIVG